MVVHARRSPVKTDCNIATSYCSLITSYTMAYVLADDWGNVRVTLKGNDLCNNITLLAINGVI